MKRTARGVENVATAPLGDRVQIRSARIVDQRLRLAVVRAGKGDASCCPGGSAEPRGRLDGSRLAVTEKQEGAGRLTADVLAGSEWVLRAWDLRDPAPEEPAITLAFAQVGSLVPRDATATRHLVAGGIMLESHGEEQASRMLALPETQRPTAFLCSSIAQAMGVRRAVLRAGLAIRQRHFPHRP